MGLECLWQLEGILTFGNSLFVFLRRFRYNLNTVSMLSSQQQRNIIILRHSLFQLILNWIRTLFFSYTRIYEYDDEKKNRALLNAIFIFHGFDQRIRWGADNNEWLGDSPLLWMQIETTITNLDNILSHFTHISSHRQALNDVFRSKKKKSRKISDRSHSFC